MYLLIVDPAIKELIVNGLMSQQASETASSSSNEESSSSMNIESERTSPRNEESTTSHCVENAPSNIGIPVWTERQEDMLVHIRHEKNNDFMKIKNHQALWSEIARELSSSLKCSISATQAMNKYYKLKKRWKEVIDSAGARGSGSEAKYFDKRGF
jgi:hypothetical protein